MERRLQTMVFRKNMAKSFFQARQLVTHGHMSIGGRKARSPSYMVTLEDESQLDYSDFSPIHGKDHPFRKELTLSEMKGSKVDEQ